MEKKKKTLFFKTRLGVPNSNSSAVKFSHIFLNIFLYCFYILISRNKFLKIFFIYKKQPAQSTAPKLKWTFKKSTHFSILFLKAHKYERTFLSNRVPRLSYKRVSKLQVDHWWQSLSVRLSNQIITGVTTGTIAA